MSLPREIPEAVRHQPRRHAAASTDEYVFSQLIPYLGNKRKLLPLIWKGIRLTGCQGGTFADLFTGSTVVARLAKTMGFRVVANDWEPYSYEIAAGTVALNSPPALAALGGVEKVFAALNELPPLDGYVSQRLCPRDDEHPDPERERMFFTRQNGRRIDAMRERIAAWESAGLLSRSQRAYLLSALVYAVSYVSNTSGVFKGFHRGWGGATRTALYRIRSVLTLKPPRLHDNGQENLAFGRDARELAGELPERLGAAPDIVYLDPPYNQHPYGSNYHVLNTVALWDKPPVPTTIAGRNKSAIRTDWRTQRRSPFNYAAQAAEAMERLLQAVRARWVLVSYSSDGLVPLEQLLGALARRGRLEVLTQKYKRYRVSTPRMSPQPHNIEFLAVVDTAAPPSARAERRARALLRAEQAALETEQATSARACPRCRR